MNKITFENVVLRMMDTEAVMTDKKYIVKDEDIIDEIKQLDTLEGSDRDGRTLLINAAIYGRKKVLEYLLSEGIDVHKVDNQKFSALHSAVIGGNFDCVKMLLEAGCNPNQKNSFGNNALMVCKLNTSKEIFNILIKYGADPALQNNYGYSAKDVFAMSEEIMMLLEK